MMPTFIFKQINTLINEPKYLQWFIKKRKGFKKA